MASMSPGSAAFAAAHARHLADVRAFTAQAVEQLSWTREQVRQAQARKLRRVVAHAQAHSPFYADRLGHLEASTLELGDLVKIPPLTKADVMTHWDRIVTDPDLRLDEVVAHLDRLHNDPTENPYHLGKYYAAATGGTSGKRGVFLWDWETFVVTTNITYRMAARADALKPPAAPRRTAVICAGSYVHASRFLFPTMLDPKRQARVFPAGTPMGQMIDQLNAYQPDRIIGYASILQELCALALDGRLKIRPTRLMANSEPLLPEACDMARRAWGVGIHNSWGSVEIGLAAMEGDAMAGLSLAEDFAVFEPVDAQDQPVTDASRADRLLVTKLYGTALPLIRYEMTDTVVIDDGDNPDAPGYRRITEIKGRADVWFIYPGPAADPIKIHPMVFRGVLGQDRHISEYQVRQTGPGARVLAITHPGFSAAPTEAKLVAALTRAGLPGAQVKIQPVDELPRHAQTGKLKRFVPLEG